MEKQRKSLREKSASSEKDISAISENRKEKDTSKNRSSGKNDKVRLKDHENSNGSSSDEDIFSRKDLKKKKAVSASNDVFDSLLSQDNKDQSDVSDSAVKKQPESSPRKKTKRTTESHTDSFSSEEDGTALAKHKDKKKKKAKDTKRKQPKRSPNKKVETYADYSSSEEDSLAKNHSTKNTAAQSPEETDSDSEKEQSKKKKRSGKSNPSGAGKASPSKNKKVAKNASNKPLNTDVAFPDQESSDMMPVIGKGEDYEKPFSDQESSEGLPDIEKVFETLEEETAREERNKLFLADRRSKSPSVTKTSPTKNDDGTKSARKKMKTMSPGKKSERNKPSPSKDKKSETSSKHDKPSESISKENDSVVSGDDENDEIDTPVPDLEVKRVRRGEKNPTEKQTLSDSVVKKPGRGRPRKLAAPEQNAKLASNSSSQIESSSSKTKEDQLVENETSPKHDRSSESISKENDSVVSGDDENDEIDTPVPDLEVKRARRGRSKTPLSQSNSNSDKVASANDSNTLSKGEKNPTEKQTLSDSVVKKLGRGRPRKAAVPEQNAKLASNSSSQIESSSSKTKEDQLEENEPKRQSTRETDIGKQKDAAKETASNAQSSLTGNAESPVYAVKSKPSPKKRKSDESQKKSKKQEKVEKHSKANTDKQGKAKKSSSMDNQANSGTESDEDNSPSKNNSKDSGEASSTTRSGEKRKPIYTSSDDSSDSDELSPQPKLDAKGKKIKREFSCHKCNAKFPRTQQLFDHTCEGKRDKGFACERCDKIYKLRSTYVNHKIIHSKKKPYKCGLCGKKSASQSNHLYHMKHSHPGRKPFPCEFFPCEKSYMTRREQIDHHKNHKRFVCPYCDEVFAKDSTLLHHKYKVHEVFFS
ncbi:Gastrula zinc finger protein XlCGF8.2DB like protein [Argiope bruennichi]|uniref:Gastrula zinc finger protein XlCGF8.2DB like protein n=1 Tax=Argiope bruennichi TaxID=94029 RepID=A0A8T0E1V1_ARGBR|nr:Gastrula zinc finger protein XlCGF8.2DB like protein [Argiope bruennichi]